MKTETLAPQLRPFPHDIEAEMALLGGIIIDGGKVATISAFASIRPEMFYRVSNGTIFAVMQDLHRAGDPIDAVTVCDGLKREGSISEAQIQSMVFELADMVPTSANTPHYAEIVIEKWRLRRQLEIAQDIAGGVMAQSSSAEIASAAQVALIDLNSSGSHGEWENAKDLTSKFMEDLDARTHLFRSGKSGGVSGMPTGFVDIDRMTSGLQCGELTIIAARPSMGKTSLMLDMAMHQADAGNRVAVFSLEMRSETVVRRAVSSLGQIPSKKLDNGSLSMEEWSNAATAATRFYDFDINITDQSDLSIQQIEALLMEITTSKRVDVVYLDYLGLIKMEGRSNDNLAKVLGDITKSLKIMAKRFDIPVVVLAQLSRSVERREDKRPLMSDLRDSGSIEEHADVIEFIYRPAYYDRKETYTEAEDGKREEVEIIIAKNRNGPTGVAKLGFCASYTRFDNLIEEGIF